MKNLVLCCLLIPSLALVAPRTEARPLRSQDRAADAQSAAQRGTRMTAKSTATASPLADPVDLGALRAEVRLNQIAFAPGDAVSATVSILDPSVPTGGPLHVLLSSPDTGDVEPMLLVPTDQPNTFATTGTVRVESFPSGGKPEDGFLSLQPGGMFAALFIPSDTTESEKPQLIADFGIMENPVLHEVPFEIAPELALTEDEIKVPEGGKRIGTVANGIAAAQIATEELIFYPRDERQLEQFLAETGGKILLQEEPIGTEQKDPNRKDKPGYLVHVSLDKADVKHLPEFRALFQETTPLYASNEDTIRIYTLALQYQLEGYLVAVNPRLQPMGAPATSDGIDGSARINAMNAGTTARTEIFRRDPFGVPDAWAMLALWDKDENTSRIPVAFLDMGFAPNPDFRGFPAVDECSLEDRGVGAPIPCGPGLASGLPTVGASFFGDLMWHGNGVVATAGGVLNNGYGTAGTGGQVVVPRLLETGLRSYAFEIGLGIRKATDDGASIINISGGYPCTVLTSVGGIAGSVDVCGTATWLAVCGVIQVALNAAVALACAVPLVNIVTCPAALAAHAFITTACIAFALAAPVISRGTMQSAVDFAISRGVTVVSISGNILRSGTPTTDAICQFVQGCNTAQDVSDWQIIPGVLPGVLCVGAAADTAPFGNEQFFGSRVDIWAPIGGSFAAPPSVAPGTSLDPAGQTLQPDFGGTSAAAPYIAGVIAMMQAVNPNLNPATASPATRATIPSRVRDILRATALPSLGVRGPLVNVAAAVKAAAAGVLPDTDALGYDRSLNLDEALAANQHDTQATARPVSGGAGGTFAGTILRIPSEGPGGVEYTDVDWFRWESPAASGVYSARVRLTTPAGQRAGRLALTLGDGRRLIALSRTLVGAEETAEYQLPPVLDHTAITLQVSGEAGGDNFYKLQFLPATRTGSAPARDRFDRAETHPSGHPDNDSPSRAARIGAGSDPWVTTETTSTTGERVHEITVTGLTFHRGDDLDHFVLAEPPSGFPTSCGDCAPYLRISAGNGVLITVLDRNGLNVATRRPAPVSSPLVLDCERIGGRAPLTILAEAGPGLDPTVPYTLRVAVVSPNAELCRLARMHEELDGIVPWLTSSGMVFIIPMGDPAPFENPALDENGLVINPSFFGIHHRGSKTFRLQAQVAMGEPLTLELLNLQGQVLASASTDPIIGKGRKPKGDELATLQLSVPNLPAGGYVLSIRRVKPGTAVFLRLPKSVTGQQGR